MTLPLVLAALAFVLRAAGQADVFVEGGVVPTGGEAWYHLRRQIFGITHFPQLLAFDPFLRFASGTTPPWAPGFDAVIGWLASGAAEGERMLAARRISAWSPAACGALSVALVFALLRPRFGAWVAALAAFVLAVLPAHVLASRVGYVNHRIAGSLLVLATLVSLVRLLRGDVPAGARGLVLAAAAGLLSAAAFWVSSSALGALWLAHFALFAHAATRRERADALAAVQRLVALELVTFACAAALGWWPPDSAADPLSSFHPSRLHVLLFGGCLLVAGACALVWRARPGASLAGRVVSLLGIGLAVDALSLALVSGLWDALRALPGALLGDPSLHAAQLEPAARQLASASEALVLFTGFGAALPLLLALALALEWRRADRSELLVLCAFAAWTAFAAWSGPGGFAAAGAGVAVATGCAVGAVWRSAGSSALPAAAVAAVLLVAAPALVAPGASRTHSRSIAIGAAAIDRDVVGHVFDWLAEHGRKGGNLLDATKRPLYSVLAPWELGHQLLFQARRAPVIDGFYPVIAPGRRELVDDVYRQAGFRSARTLQRFGTRYLLLPDVEGFPGGEVGRDALVPSLLEFDGGEAAEMQPGDPFAISFLRLVYEHGQRDAGGALRVYEHVRGARAVGTARPERLLRFSLRLRTSAGREFTYRVTAYSDPYWGSYEVRLPYSTLETKRQRFVEPLGSWLIECGDEAVSLDIPDWKVRDGAQVDAPGLCY